MIVKHELQDISNPMVYCKAAVDMKYMVTVADDYFYTFIGRQVGIKFTDLIHPDFVEEFTNLWENFPEGGKERLVTFLLGSDDLYHMVDMTISDLKKQFGKDSVYNINIYCIYSMEHRYLTAANNSNKYKMFLSMYNDYLYDYDMETGIFTILKYNSSRADIVLKDTFENVRNIVLQRMDDEKMRSEIDNFFSLVASASEGFNYELLAPLFSDYNRTVKYYINSKVVYKLNRCKVVIGILRHDDTESSIAYYERPEAKDFFTGLYNKKATQALITDTFASDKSKHYFVMMDLDNFKTINDRYGHLCGDQVILKMANIISKALAGRGIAGRFGGDEFCIFTSGIESETKLRSMLTYCRQLIKNEFMEEFGGDGLTASMGVALYPDNGNTYDDLFKMADKCLYIAKEKGKNRFIIYDPIKHGSVVETDGKLEIEASDVHRSAEEMADFVGSTAVRLARNGMDELKDCLNKARDIFNVEGIRVYTKSDKKLISHVGDYRDLPEVEGEIFAPEFDEQFKNKCGFGMSIVSHIEPYAKEFHDVSVAAGVGGFFVARYETESGDEIRVFFDAIGHKANMAQIEKDFMLVFAKIVAGLL